MAYTHKQFAGDRHANPGDHSQRFAPIFTEDGLILGGGGMALRHYDSSDGAGPHVHSCFLAPAADLDVTGEYEGDEETPLEGSKEEELEAVGPRWSTPQTWREGMNDRTFDRPAGRRYRRDKKWGEGFSQETLAFIRTRVEGRKVYDFAFPFKNGFGRERKCSVEVFKIDAAMRRSR